MLIPVVRPPKGRYRILHNQTDLVLSAALHGRDDLVVARVSVPLESSESDHRRHVDLQAITPATQ